MGVGGGGVGFMVMSDVSLGAFHMREQPKNIHNIHNVFDVANI